MLCLLGAAICWGSVPVMLKYLADCIPDGYTTNLLRYPLAAVVYLPWLIVGFRRGQLRGLWPVVLIPTAINLVGQTLWATAPYYVTPGMQAFLLRLATLWGILGAFWLFPDERQLAHSVRFWVGGALALAGFTVMSAIGLKGEGDISTTGIVIMFFCIVAYGLYGVTVRHAMGKRHPLVVFSVISVLTSIGLIAMAPLGEPSSLLDLPPLPWAILVLSALMGVAIAHGLYYIAVQRIGVAITSFTLAATPFVSIIGSSLVFGERFSAGQWVGGMVLLAGSTLALWSQQKLPVSRPDKPPPRDPVEP